VHDILRRQHWGSLVAVPLKTQSASLGSITLFYRRGLEPEQRDVDFLSTIGEMAAVAITNHQLAARMARKSALEERNRIARDLHDSVSQTMFSISLRARALQLASVSSSAAPAGMAEGLEQLHRLTSEALADMREMIHHLRPEALESEGLINLVQRHATSLHNQHGLDINVTSDVDTIDLPGADQLELLRIIQEAMGNAVRHSGSETLDVEFTADAERLAIKVIDNGSGFIIRRSPSGHFGLNTMSERATSIGATLTIESRPGHTVVHIEVPRSRGSLQ
jgi:signal transduction histidine kinase